MTNTFLDREGVISKFGIPPELIIDYLALLGDKSDNIPGVPGVGEKTALGLLQGLGGLDAIYQRLDEVAELSFRGAKTMAAKLKEHRELAYLSYTLATIKTDVAVDLNVEQLANQAPDSDKLLSQFQDLEFKTWINELSSPESENKTADVAVKKDVETKVTPSEPDTIQYETILDSQQFSVWLDRLQNCSLLAVDTETTSLNYMIADLVGISVAVDAGSAAYIPFGHDYLGVPDQLSRDTVLNAMKPILESRQIKKVGQNIKYDYIILKNNGIKLNPVDDTMLLSYTLDAGNNRHNMNVLAELHLGHKTIAYKDVVGSGKKQLNFSEVDVKTATEYAGEDADVTLRLYEILSERMIVEKLERTYEIFEKPMVKILSKLETNGIRVDDSYLKKLSKNPFVDFKVVELPL